MTEGAPPAAFMQAVRPALTRLEQESAIRFGAPGVRLVPSGYEERPFSWVLRVAVLPAGADAPNMRAFLKVFKPKDPSSGVDLRARVARDFQVTCAVHNFLAPQQGVGAVRPIAFYDDLLALATEEAAGETLLDRLTSRAAWFPRANTMRDLCATMAGVGRWLQCFQGFEQGDAGVQTATLIEYVDVRLRRLVNDRAVTESWRERVLAHLAKLAARVDPADLREVAVHADLAPANVLVDGARIVVLDFAMAGRGTRLHDISRLYLQLEALRAKPQFRAAVVAALQRAALQGFDPALSTEHPLFRFLLVLHRVNNLGTLARSRERFPSTLLNARVRRQHHAWIERELTMPEPA